MSRWRNLRASSVDRYSLGDKHFAALGELKTRGLIIGPIPGIPKTPFHSFDVVLGSLGKLGPGPGVALSVFVGFDDSEPGSPIGC